MITEQMYLFQFFLSKSDGSKEQWEHQSSIRVDENYRTGKLTREATRLATGYVEGMYRDDTSSANPETFAKTIDHLDVHVYDEQRQPLQKETFTILSSIMASKHQYSSFKLYRPILPLRLRPAPVYERQVSVQHQLRRAGLSTQGV